MTSLLERRRLLVSEAALARVLGLLLEAAADRQGMAFVDGRVASDFGGEGWSGSEERSLWVAALEKLTAGLGGKAQEVVHALKLLHAKRRKGEPAADFLLHDAESIVDAASSMPAIKSKSGGRVTSVGSFRSVEEVHDALERWVRAPGFKAAAPAPIERIDGERTWDVYLPLSPGESCSIAKMGDASIPWCTARDKNNMFYGYAKQPVWLYYVVDADDPSSKFSIGVDGRTKRIIPSQHGSTTVDSRNNRFDMGPTFGPDAPRITGFVERHAASIDSAAHPAFKDIVRAARSIDSWRTFMRNQSSELAYLVEMHRTVKVDAGTSPEVITDNLIQMTLRLEKEPNANGTARNEILWQINLGDTDPKLLSALKDVASSAKDPAVRKFAAEALSLDDANRSAVTLDGVFMDPANWRENRDALLRDPKKLDLVIARHLVRAIRDGDPKGWGDPSVLADLIVRLPASEGIDVLLHGWDSSNYERIRPALLALLKDHRKMLDWDMLVSNTITMLKRANPKKTLSPAASEFAHTVFGDNSIRLKPEQFVTLEELAAGSEQSSESVSAWGFPADVALHVLTSLRDGTNDVSDYQRRLSAALRELEELDGDAGRGFVDWARRNATIIFGHGFIDTAKRFRKPGDVERIKSSLSDEQRMRLTLDFEGTFGVKRGTANKFRKVSNHFKRDKMIDDVVDRAIEQGGAAGDAGTIAANKLIDLLVRYALGTPGFRTNADFSNLRDLGAGDRELREFHEGLKEITTTVREQSSRMEDRLEEDLDPEMLANVETFIDACKRAVKHLRAKMSETVELMDVKDKAQSGRKAQLEGKSLERLLRNIIKEMIHRSDGSVPNKKA
jgi:flagellar biosynthesis chaperone FliJ